MGSAQSTRYFTDTFDENAWEYLPASLEESKSIDVYGDVRTYKNKQSGELIDLYDLAWSNQAEYQFYMHSFNWRINQSSIVNSKYFVPHSTGSMELCSKVYAARVYIEHPMTRLSQIEDIPFPENLYVLMESLEGYQKLYKHSKCYFHPEEEQICFDYHGNVKVWVNSDLSKNYSEVLNYHQTDHKNQTHLVYQLFELISNNTDKDTEPSNMPLRNWFVKSWNEYEEIVTFEIAKIIVNNYAKYTHTNIPQQFSTLLEVYEEERIFEGEVHGPRTNYFNYNGHVNQNEDYSNGNSYLQNHNEVYHNNEIIYHHNSQNINRYGYTNSILQNNNRSNAGYGHSHSNSQQNLGSVTSYQPEQKHVSEVQGPSHQSYLNQHYRDLDSNRSNSEYKYNFQPRQPQVQPYNSEVISSNLIHNDVSSGQQNLNPNAPIVIHYPNSMVAPHRLQYIPHLERREINLNSNHSNHYQVRNHQAQYHLNHFAQNPHLIKKESLIPSIVVNQVQNNHHIDYQPQDQASSPVIVRGMSGLSFSDKGEKNRKNNSSKKLSGPKELHPIPVLHDQQLNSSNSHCFNDFEIQDKNVIKSLPLQPGHPSSKGLQFAQQGNQVMYSHINESEKFMQINQDGFGLSNQSHKLNQLKESSLSNNKTYNKTEQNDGFKKTSKKETVTYYYDLDQQVELDPDIANDIAKYLS